MYNLQTLRAFDLPSKQDVIESVLSEKSRFLTQLDLVALLNEDIEASFNKNVKAGIVFVDFWAAYDTVWLCGLTLKLLKTIPSKEMVRAIMDMISLLRFHVHIGKSKSRCWTLLNGAPQGSVIATTLYNLYTYDIPTTVSRKYIHAYYIAMIASDKCLQFLGLLNSFRRYWQIEKMFLQLAAKVE